MNLFSFSENHFYNLLDQDEYIVGDKGFAGIFYSIIEN